MSMNPNIVGGFSPEGFFRQADTGKGGGAGSGKDDDPVVKKPDQEPLDILEQLENNINQIGYFIRTNNSKEAEKLAIKSRALIGEYEPGTDSDRRRLLFLDDRLRLKEKPLYLLKEKLDTGSVKQDKLSQVKKEQLVAEGMMGTDEDSNDNIKKKLDTGSVKQVSHLSQAKKEQLTDDIMGTDENDSDNKSAGDVEQSANIEEVTNLLLSFDNELKILEDQSFVFADDRDWVSESFEEISGHLATLKGSVNVDKEAIKTKEILLLQLEYKKRREAMFKTLTEMEKSQSLTEGFFARAIEGPGLTRMDNIVSRLKPLMSQEDNEKYQKDLDKIKEHYKARKWLLITWLYINPKVYEGSGPEGARTSFGQVGDNQFPIKGGDFQELILGGLDFNHEFGGLLNQKLGVESVLIDKFGERLKDGAESDKDKKEKKDIEVTLFTFCMREFDKIYKDKDGTGNIDPEDKNKTITKITTQNLRENNGPLIDYVWKKAKQYKKEHGGDFADEAGAEIDKHAIDIAFRTHLILTMHHCRYASGSPSLRDDWYYAFNWPDYVLSYRKKGVDKFDWLVTMLQFGLRPGFNGDQVSNTNLLALLFDASAVRKAQRKLEARGMLNEGGRGLRSLRGLINGYAISLPDVSPQVTQTTEDTSDSYRKPDKKPEYSFLAPPLRYLRQKGKDGKFVTHSAPEGSNGLHVFLDEIRDEKGNLLYEEFNYEQLGNDLMDYYNNMNAHGIDNFLNKFIKTERFEFMENATSPKVLKNWKNEARYCATLLPRVGKFALMNMKDSGDPVKLNPSRYPTEESKRGAQKSSIAEAVMDRILYQIVFINCMLRTDYTIDDKYFWSDIEVRGYLSNLSSEQILTTQEADAIYEVVMAYRGQVKIFLEGVRKETAKQIIHANLFK